MIPHQLTLKNFLSYREATLDFTGLHTACICGPNGAGKTSLLEAISWALWGNCRAATEEDIIHIGEKEARVDFSFISQQQIYRVIRTRRRGQTGSLDFQVATTPHPELKTGEALQFRPLTEKGMRATQQKILDHLKLDYDTFINSAYLRQGRADEFMLKRPNERKEILANLLKLDQYDTLADQAKDLARQYKGQIELLENTIDNTGTQLQERETLQQNLKTLETTLTQLQAEQDADREQLQKLQAQQHHRETWEKVLAGEQQQHTRLTQEYERLQREIAHTQQQTQELAALLDQAPAIEAGYQSFQQLQAREETLAAQFRTSQELQQRRHQLESQQQKTLQALTRQIEQVQTRLEGLEQQETELLEILKQRPDVEAGLAQLQAVRRQLNHFESLQLQVSPLLQRQHQKQLDLERAQAGLTARLHELRKSVTQLQRSQQQETPRIQQTLSDLAHQISELEKKRVYQQRVREKGQERHQFMERLRAQQRDYEAKLVALEQKIQLLLQKESQEPDETGTLTPEFPPCPLCDRPLDEHHWNLVLNKQKNQQEELRNHIWVVKEQLAISNREILVLRHEYQALQQELVKYDQLREQRGNYQAQLQGLEKEAQRLAQLVQETEELETSLRSGSYSAELITELEELKQQLATLNYDEQDHALARNEEKRLRWAEIKQGQLKDSETKLAKLRQQRPELLAEIQRLTQELKRQETESELSQEIARLVQEILEIGYDINAHNQVRQELRQNQSWLTREQELRQARQQFPRLQERIEELNQLLTRRREDLAKLAQQIQALEQQLATTPDTQEEVQILEPKIQGRRGELDQYLALRGQLQAQQQNLERLQTQWEEQKQQLSQCKRQQIVYQELAQAFGKNGIQALMIETVLPQLEAETNQILARLSANQLHIQFVTQRAKRGQSSNKKNAKLIDTLDILIADTQGTRPYETYSGGEAFRINFAIRLALAKLLAQRSGTALQMLIIDEGFGTQDAEGCERLIASINAIASDFACILTVTHIPHLKEAFQARIEVEKTPQGSQLRLSI